MGINGLLPLLKSIHKSCNLKKFEGKTLAVDAYGWLHRGTVACAMDLAMGKPTRKFVDFAMHRVRMLQHFGVIPFLVFDGDYLPSKAATETDRSKRRDESRKRGFDLLNAGKTSQAYLEFQKAVDVTPEMARQLIDELRKTGVQYIVAPYEADAQMVYLERKGLVDGILSEDSDLLVFGAKCLLTKLDQYGNCIEINKADFCACKEVNLTGWSETEFRHMAILSGCDYLASINNMGLKTAYRMVRKHKTIEKVIRMLQFDGKFHVPKGYFEAFQQAEWTFLHQRVFCPRTLSLVLHTEPQQSIDLANMPYIGAVVEPQIAQGVARGDLNPMTKLPIVSQIKNAARTSSTPWAASQTKHKRAPSDNLKKGVPIDEFFKPKRVPLAELDINCFTPSPSQQQALLRNPGPWLSNPVPRPYLNRPATESEQRIRSEPRLSHARVVRAESISETRPPKRARLCGDFDTPLSPDKKLELGSSRFFASNVPDPSPSIGRYGRSKRSRKQDVNIYSDDSIEEAMMGLPNVESFTPTSSKKLQIFSDSHNNCDREELEISQTDLPDSQNTLPSLTTSTSTTSSQEQPPTPTDKNPSTAPILDLKTRFNFSPISTPKSYTASVGIPTPLSSSTKPSKIPLAVNRKVTAPRAQSTKTNLTPLQRLGASAVNRSHFPTTPPETPTYLIGRDTRRRSTLSKTSVLFPEVANEIRAKTIEPASIPLPLSDETENAALSLAIGSEDLMVRDSEGEDEALSPGPYQEYKTTRHLNLGHFTFTGLS